MSVPGGPTALGQASGCLGQCLAYHFQFLGRRLNTAEGPIEALAVREGATKRLSKESECMASPSAGGGPPPPTASSQPNDILGSALVFGGSLTRAGADSFLTDLSLTPN